MKKLLIMLAGVILPLAFFAQDTPLSSVFDKYADKSGFETQEIIPSQTSMEWEKDTETNALRQIMNKISSVRIINSKEGKNSSRKSMRKEISDAVEKADYIDLMTVKSDNESIRLFALKVDSRSIREFALFIDGDEEVMLITVTGDIDMSLIDLGEVMGDMKKLGKEYKGEKECTKEL